MARHDQPSPLVRHLGRARAFTPGEESALVSLERETITATAKTMLVGVGEAHDQAYVVKSAWLARHHTLSDGGEQILDFAIPGDLLGLEGTVLETADHSVTALDDVTVAPFSFTALRQVVREHPRLLTAVLWSAASEKAALGHRITSLGRRSAYDATAHLILALRDRLDQRGLLWDQTSFPMSLSQQDLANALGLSVVHMNRILRRLDDDKVVTKTRTSVKIHDLDLLTRIAMAASTSEAA
jgi:CRP-like cAMP-binding protein